MNTSIIAYIQCIVTHWVSSFLSWASSCLLLVPNSALKLATIRPGAHSHNPSKPQLWWHSYTSLSTCATGQEGLYRWGVGVGWDSGLNSQNWIPPYNLQFWPGLTIHLVCVFTVLYAQMVVTIPMRLAIHECAFRRNSRMNFWNKNCFTAEPCALSLRMQPYIMASIYEELLAQANSLPFVLIRCEHRFCDQIWTFWHLAGWIKSLFAPLPSDVCTV